MVLKYLIEKEFKQIFRDKFLPKILFIMPVLQLLILPLAANFEMRNINIAVVDEDHTTTSRLLTERVAASNYFNFVDSYSSYNEALASIENLSSDVILQLPRGLEKDITNNGFRAVLIAANAVNGTKGGLGSSYLSSIITNSNIQANTIYLNNPHLNYKYYMVPAIIAFLLTLVGGFVSALNIVAEKEKGTIEQINVSPIPKHIFLSSKIIPFWVIGMVELTLGLLVAWGVYGMIPEGSYLTIYLFASIYLLFCTGFGLAVSSVSATGQQAMFSAFFFLIIMALMSGLFTPINSMPEWAQNITILNPMRYFVELLRSVFLKGGVLTDFTTHFIAITIIATVVNLCAIWGYRKRS
ncbi:MAG: ABC transporter permease [Rikenellaceae bacterium]